jgi:hypothetical protein
MRWLLQAFIALVLCLSGHVLGAADFKMADGAVITGELVAPNEDGSVIRRASGGLTSRIGWDRFAQETLIELANDPKLKDLVEAYIDRPEEALEAERAEIVVRDPPGRLQRPEKRPGFFASFSTPAGLFIVLVLLAANLYAAYEVSIFRNYPAAAVMGTSIILPVLGPILFLCMPTRDVVLEGQYEAPQEVQNTGAQELAAAGLSGSGLALSAAHKSSGGTQAQVTSYRRGEIEFNRQFFERTFPQFFRLTRSDSDSTVLSVRSSKGEVVAVRISRISSNEIGLITQKGHEVQLRFADISEVTLRPKAA